MKNRTGGEGGQEVSLRPEWPFLVALALMGLVLFFYRLGAPGLMDPDEGRYAEIAREIFLLHDWLIPHLNLSPYLEKPPLVYWLTALSFKALGANELAARLPSAASALGGLFLAYWLGRSLWGPALAFLGATVLATCSGYVVLGRLLTLDMTFSFLLNLAIALGYLALSRERRELWPWAYAVLGLAVLAKGPVALLLAGLIWGIWVLIQRRSWRSLLQPRGWLILAVLVLPWFAYVQWRYPDFFRYFILEHHFGRFLTPAIHPEPFYYYGPVLLGLLLPWSWLLPWVLFSRGEGRDPDRTFLLVWAAVVLIFFSLSRGKLAPYILPALLPLALIMGEGLGSFSAAVRTWAADPGLRISLWAWALAGFSAMGLVLWPPSTLAQALSRANLALHYLLLVAAVFTLTPLVTLVGRRLSPLFLGALLLSALLPVGLDRLSSQRSPRELGRMVQSLWQPDAALVGVYLYSQGLSFYSGQVFHLLDFRTELDFGRKLRPEKDLYFAGVGEMADFAGTRPQVFFYVKEHDLESLKPELPGKIQLLARQRDCLLLAYQRE
jgi:4-amino-4-deoxy-L-arabinose transferase-like glycosyltransferase